MEGRKKLIFLLSVFVVLSVPAFSQSEVISSNQQTAKELQYQPLQVKLGFSLGWEFPYSTGVEMSFLFNELIDANVGCALGRNGAKYGIGTRIYPLRNAKFSPMAGAYLYHATGFETMNLTLGAEEAVYRINSDNALLLNAGARFRFGKGHYVLAGVGYSIPFKGEGAEYISGSTANSVRDFARIFEVGGFSLQAGILIKLSKGSYKLQV